MKFAKNHFAADNNLCAMLFSFGGVFTFLVSFPCCTAYFLFTDSLFSLFMKLPAKIELMTGFSKPSCMSVSVCISVCKCVWSTGRSAVPSILLSCFYIIVLIKNLIVI